MNASREGYTMVVVERGGRLPTVDRPRHPTHLLVRQREKESGGALVARIRGELSYLDANARSVDEAVISCGRGSDSSACDARVRFTSEVLERLRTAHHARLVLFADEDADAELRAALVSLAERARAVLAKAGGSVTVRFGDHSGSDKALARTRCTSGRTPCAALDERVRSVA